MNEELPIGVFDSGVGGLTVLRALREHLPDEHYLYLGDTARLPYGTKSDETVTRYAVGAARHLSARGIKLLVVACNTASASALPELRRVLAPMPVVGVVEPGADAAARASKRGEIMVIATESTIRGGAYERAIVERRADARVHGRACPLFVALAEEGWITGDVVEKIAAIYLADLRELAVDTLVLGCTHFPVLRETLNAVAGPGVELVDSAATTAAFVGQWLRDTGRARRGGEAAKTRFLATDAPARFARVGRVFLGHEIAESSVELVDL